MSTTTSKTSTLQNLRDAVRSAYNNTEPELTWNKKSTEEKSRILMELRHDLQDALKSVQEMEKELPPPPPEAQIYFVMADCCTSGNCIQCKDVTPVGTTIRRSIFGDKPVDLEKAKRIKSGWATYRPTIETADGKVVE